MTPRFTSFAGRLGALLLALAAAATAQAALAKRDKGLEQRLLDHIAVLASDAFEGRQPGTEGEAKTLHYIGEQWFKAGLVSGTNDPGHEWFAPVTLVAREPASSTAMFARRGARVFVPPDDILMLTSGKRSLLRDAPLLFVGRAGGRSFARSELAGRVAVVLDDGKDDGRSQDILLSDGASAVLTVLDSTRTLEQVAARRARSGYALADEKLGGDLEGFVTRAGMTTLLKGSRFTLTGLEKVASKPDFTPVPLGISASLEATTRETTIHTYNVIGKIPGRDPKSGAVLLLAHWDHFGFCAKPPATDLICNGAVDNASGVAALTEIARRLAKAPRMTRDVYVLATTGEEMGLLGAHAFAENPPIPLDRFVAAFNIDSDAIAPYGTPLAIVGKGMTPLDAGIEKVAQQEHRKIVNNDDANRFVRRQDGWALMQHDVPTVMVASAYGDMERVKRFYDTRYHRPNDDLSDGIELGGEAQDVQFLVALTRWFADPKNYAATVK